MASDVDGQEGEEDKRALLPMARRDGEDNRSRVVVGDVGESADRGHVVGYHERRPLVDLGAMGMTASARGQLHHNCWWDGEWDEAGAVLNARENKRRWVSQVISPSHPPVGSKSCHHFGYTPLLPVIPLYSCWYFVHGVR